MKKLIAAALVFSLITFQYCSSSKKIQAPPKVSYATNVQPILQSSCTPCHFPPGGNKKPLNTYSGAKDNIDEIIARIQKNPGEKGFMPMKHPKLPDSTILVFVHWKNDGLLEQ
ncbi:MAG: hypothetical protein ACM3VS_15785 [Candidatus Dadabacteria bacterium]